MLTQIKHIVESLHERIFGHPMSDEMRSFIGNLSFSFILGVGTAGILFIVNIGMARMLGPAGYGGYNLFLSLATSSTFIFLLGTNTSSTRYVADNEQADRKNRLMSAALSLVMLQAIGVFLVSFLLGEYFSQKFQVSTGYLMLILLFGFVFSIRELLDGILRALTLFKRESWLKLLDAAIVLSSVAAIYLFSYQSIQYYHYIFSLVLGASFFIFLAIIFLYPKFERFSWQDVKLLLHYNKYLIIAGLSGLFLSSEKAFLSIYISNEELGVYSAYYTASQTVISTAGIMFMNIFWPNVIKSGENMQPIVEKLKILFLRYFPALLILNCLSTFVFVQFFGSQYPFRLSFVILFASASLLNIIFFVFMSILNIRKIGLATIINLSIYGLMVGSIFLFKNVSGYLLAQISIYVLAIAYVLYRIHKTYILKQV